MAARILARTEHLVLRHPTYNESHRYQGRRFRGRLTQASTSLHGATERL